MTVWQWFNSHWVFWAMVVVMVGSGIPMFYVIFFSKLPGDEKVIPVFVLSIGFFGMLAFLMWAIVGGIVLCDLPISAKLLICQR